MCKLYVNTSGIHCGKETHTQYYYYYYYNLFLLKKLYMPPVCM